MTRFPILAVLVALAASVFFASPLAAQTTVRDSLKMRRQVDHEVLVGSPDRNGFYLYSCRTRIMATWPDVLGTERALSYQHIVPGGQRPFPYVTNPIVGDTYVVPGGHVAIVGYTLPGTLISESGRLPDPPDLTRCNERQAQVLALEAGLPQWYATYTIADGTPIALFEQEPAGDLSVTFDASFESGQSREIDATQPTGKRPVVSYAWDFGDANTGTGPRTGPKPVYTFPRADTFNVTLTVTDDDGQTDDHVEVVIVESVLTVNSINDDGDGDLTDDLCDTGQEVEVDGEMVPECTLRAALELANARGGDRITFKILGDGVPTISVGANGLPDIEHQITIDGTTQSGGLVELAGPGQDTADPSISGISVQSGGAGSTLRGLVIHGFKEAGVYLRSGADGCTLEGNRIGTDATGLVAKGNGSAFDVGDSSWAWGGIWIESDDNRIIGNVVAGNFAPAIGGGSGGTDILIQGNRNVLEGNKIGVGVDGVPLILPDLGPLDRYIGVWIHGTSTEVVGNRIGGPGEIGGAADCVTPQCNTIQGHTLEIYLGWVSRGQPFAGRGTEISGNVIGSDSFDLPEGAIVTYNAINDTNSKIDGIAENARVAFNYIIASESGILIRGSDGEVIGNTVLAVVRRSQVPGPALDNSAAIETGPDATVTENTVFSSWIGVSAGQGSTVFQNRLAAPVAVLVRSDSPVVLASQNTTPNCNAGRPDAGLVHLGGDTFNPHFEPISPERRNDWGDTDGFANSPVIVRAERSGGQVQIQGYVRTSLTVSEVAIEVNACGNGDYVTTHTTPTSVGVTEFEITLTDVETEAFAFTATHDGESTSEGLWFPIASQASSSTVEIPSTSPGASASGQGADLTVVEGSQGRTQRQAAARVFITRFNTPADTSVFADTTATAPNGESIRPEAVAFRTWMLRDIGLSRESVDPAVAATFDVCFEVSDDVVHPEQQASVVIVQRSSQGFNWRPLDTTLEPRDGTPALCARSLETLGEFGFGGAEGAFPVSAEPDEVLGALPSVLALRAFPNPASDRLSVEGTIPQAGAARVSIHDALGREVAVLHDGPLAAGVHAFGFSTRGLAPGVYVLRLATPESAVTRRATVVR